MLLKRTSHWWCEWRGRVGLMGLLAAIAVLPVQANPAELSFEALPESTAPVFTLESAMAWALQNNPELAALRQQRGIAEAGVVIARTYPFNPILENRIQGASGPASAGIDNRVPLEHLLLLEVEIRGQRGYRRQVATAALSRTEWEVAFQEQTLAVRVMRAFSTLLYRQEKLRLIEETIRINEQLLQDVRKLQNAGTLSGADVIVAQTEVDAVRALRGGGRTAVVTARYELARALGLVDGAFDLQGALEMPIPAWDEPTLMDMALQRRADLHARQSAVAEAEASVRLEVADRFGNPVIGPVYTYDPTRVSAVGAQINFPLPVFNTHRGQILQRQAEQARAFLELRQTEMLVRQDVQAALARLRSAAALAETYRTRTLPGLQKSLQGIERLFRAGEAGVDVLRVIDVRRKLLTARDNYLDALFEVSQARADLAAAVGEPVVKAESCLSAETPGAPTLPNP